jgi:hypothetical protein
VIGACAPIHPRVGPAVRPDPHPGGPALFIEEFSAFRQPTYKKTYIRVFGPLRPRGSRSAQARAERYGDRVSHDVKGGGINFQPQILIQCSSAGDDEEFIDISAAPEAAGGATCAAPLGEVLTPCRGLRPHHVQKDRIGTWVPTVTTKAESRADARGTETHHGW